MASGKTCFNAAVYRRALSRFWLIALAYASVLAFLVLANAPRDTFDYQSYPLYVYLTRPMVTAAAIAALVMAMAVHGWMFRKTSAAYIAALPISREALLTSSILAGLTLLVLPCLVMAVCSFLFCGGFGAECHAAIRNSVLTVLCMNIAFFGIATFCTAFTGSEGALAAMYTILLFGFVGLEAACRYVAQFLLYGVSGGQWVLAVLSPVYFFAVYQNVTLSEGLKIAALYALFGVGCCVLSVWLFRRRRMESAGDVVAVPALRALFRWLLALAGALGMALLMLKTVFNFTDYSWYISGGGTPARIALLLLAMLLGAAVGWFGADALMRKTLRVFDRHWKGLGVLCLLLCAAVIGCDLDVFGVERYLPDADDVSYATVNGWGEYGAAAEVREEENIEKVFALQRSILSHKNEYESAFGANTLVYPLYITYYDENGTELLSRTYCYAAQDRYSYVTGGSYTIPTDEESGIIEDLTTYEKLLNTRECTAQRTVLDRSEYNAILNGSVYWYNSDLTAQHYFELTEEEFWDLYETCIYPDWVDGLIGQVKIVQDEDYFTESESVSIGVSLAYISGSDDGPVVYSVGYYLSPTAYSKRTNEWLHAHGAEIYTLAELYGK